jgi:hypothetical protein
MKGMKVMKEVACGGGMLLSTINSQLLTELVTGDL